MEKKTPKNDSDVGDVMGEHVKAKLNDGRVIDAIIGAASQQDGETKIYYRLRARGDGDD